MSRFFVFLSCLICCLQAEESYDNAIVEKIEVSIENLDIDTSFDTKALIARLKTRVGDPFSQLVFDQDLKNLSEEFDAIKPELREENNKLFITIALRIKPLIKRIAWHGNNIFSTNKLQKELGIKINSVFSRDKFNKALNKIKELYLKKGYFESQITYAAEPGNKKNEILIDVTINEGKSGKIQDIVFKGFTKEEKSDLLGMIYTKKYYLLFSWLTGQGIFKEEALDQDQMTIVNYLHNKGYADAKVKIKILEDKASNKIIIEISAEKGELYRFGKVTFEGNHLISDSEILKCFSVHPDDLYSPDKIRNSAQTIKDLYGKKGYIESQVIFETHLKESKNIYDVDFIIEEGESFKIGLIRIFGNTQTNSNIILRESLLVPGEVFDSQKLKATQQRLENIGYFKSVNVYAVKASDELGLGPNYRDVYIEVEEAMTGHINLSIGISSLDSIVGGVELNETNFNYKGLKNLFSEGTSALRGGGEFLQIQANAGAKQQSYLLSWMTPSVMDSLWRFGFESSVTRSKLQSSHYNIKTYGFSIFASYPLSDFWTFGTKYRIRNAHNEIKESAGEEAVEEGRSKGWVSAISSSIGYDSTDNPIKSHRGIRSILEAEFAGVGGKYRFIKCGYVNSLYYPIWSKGTIKYRADLKYIFPVLNQRTSHVPLSERFFLGGETTVRGYKPYSLGPHFKEAELVKGERKSSHDPKGGISSALFSVEYSQEIIKIMDVFLFVDAGSVSQKKFIIPKLRGSTGIGIRLEVMNKMPFTFGYGFPLNPERHSDRQQFFFSMGGQF